MTQNNEREAFELNYAHKWQKASENARQYSIEHLCKELKEMRKGENYGEDRDYLNFTWEGWQARVQSPISQNEQQEAVAERDKLGYAVVEVIGKLDEIIEVAEDIEFIDLAHIAIPLELWNELKDALELMPERADNYTSPPKQAIPEESAWLIEKYINGKLHYAYCDEIGILDWTNDSLAAMRFSRKKDAAQLTSIMEDADRVAEHMWVAPTNTEVENE